MESQAEPFVYKESFSNILPPKSNEILKVIVWTIIDGQLIAKSSVNYLNDDETRLVFWTKKDYYPYHNVISPFLDVKTINFSGSLAHLPNLLGCYLKKRYLFVCFCLSNSYVCLWNLISRKIVFFFSRTLIWLHLQHPDLKMMMISLMTKSWIKQVQLLLLFQMTNLSIFNVPPSMNPVRIF